MAINVLQKNTSPVEITACGILHVNRQIVPKLVGLRGLAGRLASQGTLWLAAEFAERHKTQQTAVEGTSEAHNKETRIVSLIVDDYY